MNIKFNSIFLVLLFSIILIGCKKEGANTSSNSHGKLEVVGGITHDWGEIKVSTLKDNQLKTSFILKNIGDGDLFIKEVRPGCGCTSAPLTKDLLKPGDTTIVNVTLNTTGKHGQTDKSITITATDPMGISKDSLAKMNDTTKKKFDSTLAKDSSRYDTTLVYSLKANLRRTVTVTPGEYFSLVDPKKGVESSSSVKISNSGDVSFSIISSEVVKAASTPASMSGGSNPPPAPQPKIRLVLVGSKDIAPGKETEIKVFVTPTGVGQISGTVSVKTTSQETPILNLPVYGYVQDKSPQKPVTGSMTPSSSH